MKYYVLNAEVAKAVGNKVKDVIDLSDETFKELSVVYKKQEFQDAFNDYVLKSENQFLRIL